MHLYNVEIVFVGYDYPPQVEESVHNLRRSILEKFHCYITFRGI